MLLVGLSILLMTTATVLAIEMGDTSLPLPTHWASQFSTQSTGNLGLSDALKGVQKSFHSNNFALMLCYDCLARGLS